MISKVSLMLATVNSIIDANRTMVVDCLRDAAAVQLVATPPAKAGPGRGRPDAFDRRLDGREMILARTVDDKKFSDRILAVIVLSKRFCRVQRKLER